MEVPVSVAPGAYHDAFDNLLAEVEADPVASKRVSEGRRWVAQAFYGEVPLLASLRLAAGLSQRQLGAVCGLNQPHVSRYESGRHEPGIAVAATMAQALGVDLNTFAAAWHNTQAQANHGQSESE